MHALLPSAVTVILVSVLPMDFAQAQDDAPLPTAQSGTLLFNHDLLSNLSYRDLRSYLSLVPGIVEHDGQLSVRGSRGGDITYMLDGFSLLNPMRRELVPAFVPEAMEEIRFAPGGSDDQHAWGSAGLVFMRVKTGGDTFAASLNYTGDEFVKSGQQFLGGTSRGQRHAVITFGGPVPGLSNLRYFVSYQNRVERNRQSLFLSPFRLDGLKTDPWDDRLLPAVISFDRNTPPGNWSEAHTVVGSVALNDTLSRFSIRLTGMWDHTGAAEKAGWPDALVWYFNSRRIPELRTVSGFVGVQGDYRLSAATTMSATLRYSDRTQRTLDPTFGSDWRFFTDSSANAAAGFAGFTGRWHGPLPYDVLNGLSLRNENAPNTSYRESRETGWECGVVLRSSISPNWNLELGGKMQWWTSRLFSIADISSYYEYLSEIRGNSQRTFASEQERRILLSKAGKITNYGYDIDGNQSQDEPDGPRTPQFGTLSVKNTIRCDIVTLAAGLRLEYLRSGNLVPDYSSSEGFNLLENVLNESKFTKQKGVAFLLPELRASITLSPQASLFASYTATVRYPSLGDLYSNGVMTTYYSFEPVTRNTPLGFMASVEHRKQGELGMSYDLAGGLSLRASGYVVGSSGLLTVRPYEPNGWGEPFPVYVNEDETVSRGIDLSLVRARQGGVELQLHYALAESKGTGSTPLSSWGTVNNQVPVRPTVGSLLDQNRTHRLTCILDVGDDGRWKGTMIEETGATLIVRYTSGRPYTRIAPLEQREQSTAWNVGVYQLNNRWFAKTLEGINTSAAEGGFSIDLAVRRSFVVGPLNCEAYLIVTNLLNAKNSLAVYPTTGSADNDGWLGSELYHQTGPYSTVYDRAYQIINSENRYAYANATGTDMFSEPREVRIGLRLGL
jgi:hypothetical protein